MSKKKTRTKWVGLIKYENGFFRSGIVKNNKPKKHDVIRVQFRKEIPRGKTGISIDIEDWHFTLDEAMAVNFILSKAILIYTFQAPQDVRLWEYEDKLKTLKVVKKKKNDRQIDL